MKIKGILNFRYSCVKQLSILSSMTYIVIVIMTLLVQFEYVSIKKIFVNSLV